MRGILRSRNKGVRPYAELKDDCWMRSREIDSKYSFLAMDREEFDDSLRYLSMRDGLAYQHGMFRLTVPMRDGYGIFTHVRAIGQLEAIEAELRRGIETGMASDPTGEGWIADAIHHEMLNYEWMFGSGKHKLAQILAELGLKGSDYDSDPRIRRAVSVADERIQRRGW